MNVKKIYEPDMKNRVWRISCPAAVWREPGILSEMKIVRIRWASYL